jgi:hypothetical protein
VPRLPDGTHQGSASPDGHRNVVRLYQSANSGNSLVTKSGQQYFDWCKAQNTWRTTRGFGIYDDFAYQPNPDCQEASNPSNEAFFVTVRASSACKNAKGYVLKPRLSVRSTTNGAWSWQFSNVSVDPARGWVTYYFKSDGWYGSIDRRVEVKLEAESGCASGRGSLQVDEWGWRALSATDKDAARYPARFSKFAR